MKTDDVFARVCAEPGVSRGPALYRVRVLPDGRREVLPPERQTTAEPPKPLAVQDVRHWASLNPDLYCWLATNDFWPGWWGSVTKRSRLSVTWGPIAQWKTCYRCASLEMWP